MTISIIQLVSICISSFSAGLSIATLFFGGKYK